MNIQTRKRKYITENPNGMELVFADEVMDFEALEKELHEEYREKRHRGEWFNLDESDVADIIGQIYSYSIFENNKRDLKNKAVNDYDCVVLPKRIIRMAWERCKDPEFMKMAFGTFALVESGFQELLDNEKDPSIWDELQDIENEIPSREEMEIERRKFDFGDIFK